MKALQKMRIFSGQPDIDPSESITKVLPKDVPEIGNHTCIESLVFPDSNTKLKLIQICVDACSK